jgi:hypothetical protein
MQNLGKPKFFNESQSFLDEEARKAEVKQKKKSLNRHLLRSLIAASAKTIKITPCF